MAKMSPLTNLCTLLQSALNAQLSQVAEQNLYEELIQQRPLLLRVFDVGRRNLQEQKEVEAGKVMVHGKTLAVNADFARQVLFIAQELDCSEYYIAELLHDVMSGNPNISQELCIESTVLEFHLRRRQVVDCLRCLFQATELADASGSPPLYLRLSSITRDMFQTAENTLAIKILDEICSLEDVINRALLARQNAGSTTIVPVTEGGRLGSDILAARCDSLRYERRALGSVLYLISRMRLLCPPELITIMDWLHANPNHPMIFYFIPIVLTAFDLLEPPSKASRAEQALIRDKQLMLYMKKKFAASAEWKEPGLKGVILLKWTLFLTDARRRQADLEDVDGFKSDELETQIWNAIQGDCFAYLARVVTTLRKDISSPVAAVPLISPEQDLQLDLPPDDFRSVTLEDFEKLIRSLITYASSELRRIKQRQEDLLLATTRTTTWRSPSHSQSRFNQGPTDFEKASAPRNDMATMFSFMGLLYSALPPDFALPYWGSDGGGGLHNVDSEYLQSAASRLPSFLQWAVWSTQPRDLGMMTALYDMLAGLSKGQQCSELAYNFLAKGGGEALSHGSNNSSPLSGPAVSWSAMFALLEVWAAAGAPPRAPAPPIGISQGFPGMDSWQAHRQPALQSQAEPQQRPPLTQQDVLLAQSFLRLLSTVVSHSITARITIAGHARFRAIPTLVSLIPLSIPLELKAAIFDTLAAFCQAAAGVAGLEICRSVWILMEKLEVINVRGSAGVGPAIPSVKGVEVELEEVESVYKIYPATIAFLNLLSTLMHTPKGLPWRERLAHEQTNTIPEALGQPYRPAGIAPYISFVADNVFSRISRREYLDPSDRWKINDLCLCFIERCLASYNLESLLMDVENLVLPQLVAHPGYDIMTRMLSQSCLQTSVLSYLVEGIDGFDKGFAIEEPFFRNTMVRVLRIIRRVLELQTVFLDVLIPILGHINDSTVAGEVYPASHFVRLDQALFFVPEYISAVVAYVSYDAHLELVYLSVKILTLLTTPANAGQLATILNRSPESIRILNGFRSIIDADVSVNIETAETVAEQTTGAGALDPDEGSDALLQATRLAVLDYVIQHTHANQPYPNVAHFLLFGEINIQDEIQDPQALGARRTCIHALLDLLNTGIPWVLTNSGGGGGGVRETMLAEPLLATLPELAERCYHIVYQLCKHPQTSDFAMRYLRSREDFFVRHLLMMPFKAPVLIHNPYIEVVYHDGSRATTTVSSLCSFLRLRSWLLDLIALELHMLANRGHHKSSTRLLKLLFGSGTDALDKEAPSWENNASSSFQELGKSHVRMIEYLQSLNFDWSDSLTVQPVNLKLLGQINLQTCICVDSTGCEVIDRTTLLSLLMAARASLHIQGSILTQTHVQELSAEMAYVLESCAIENHRREVQYAVKSSYEAWRRVLDVALMQGFSMIPVNQRENILVDLLYLLPSTLLSTNIEEPTAIMLAEATLTVMTKLRENQLWHPTPSSSGSTSEYNNLPPERLHSLLRNLLECVINHTHFHLVRGNLYASLIQYLHLVIKRQSFNGPQDLDTFLTTTQDVNTPFEELTGSFLEPQQSHAHMDDSLTILQLFMQRLVHVIARDAIDGTEVWKTVSFLLLDCLMVSSFLRTTVTTVLSHSGYFASFVKDLNDVDLELQAILKPDPDDLNSLYVYEAKMSFFTRMAQNKSGAEQLIECQFLPSLAKCSFLDARPETNQAFFEHHTFLPAAVQRYHQLLMPALQVTCGILCTLGSVHNTAIHQAIGFLRAHRDTLVMVIKSELDDITALVLEEIYLLISSFSYVLLSIPQSELLSSSGLGSLHRAILNLAAQCLGNKDWLSSVDRDSVGDEQSESSESDSSIQFRKQLLCKSLITYLVQTCSLQEDFCVILTPVVSMPKQAEYWSSTTAAPSLGGAFEALQQLCINMSIIMKQSQNDTNTLGGYFVHRHKMPKNFSSIASVLQAHQPSSDNMHIYSEFCIGSMGHLSMQSIEMLLFLIWKHLIYYSTQTVRNGYSQKVLDNMLHVSYSVSETFLLETTQKLESLMQQLSSISQNMTNSGTEWQQYEFFISTMVQKIQHISNHDM